MINRLELEHGTTATHKLKAKNRHDQQARIAARYHSYSLPGESRTGIISSLELEQGIKAIHFLNSQGQA
jgi:hypothetical protein